MCKLFISDDEMIIYNLLSMKNYSDYNCIIFKNLCYKYRNIDIKATLI